MIKIGVIGCGYWGKNHVRVLKGLPCELVGIADTDETKREVANLYHTEFFTNYRKLLRRIDAAVIVTPPKTHYRIASEALRRGIHVFVEKPFTKKLFQAKRLVRLAEENSKALMVGHIFIYSPAYQYIKNLLSRGELGEIYYVYTRRVNFGILRNDVNALENFAPHDFSLITSLLGKPRTIRAIGQDIIQKGIEDIVFIHMGFGKKVSAHVHLSWLDPQKQRQLVIVGSKKMLIWDDTNPDRPLALHDKSFAVPELWQQTKTWKTYSEFQVKTTVGETSYPRIQPEEPLKNELTHFLEYIQTGKQPISDGKQGILVTRLITLAQKSLRSKGKEIEVED